MKTSSGKTWIRNLWLAAVLLLVCVLALPAAGEEIFRIPEKTSLRSANPSEGPALTGPLNVVVGKEYAYRVSDNSWDWEYRMYECVMVGERPWLDGYYRTNPVSYSYNYNTNTLPVTFQKAGYYELVATREDSEGNMTEISLPQICAQEASNELMAKVRNITSECAQSVSGEYATAVWLHDYLTEHAHYDTTRTEYGPEGVLLKGYGVCDSYSQAYEMLLTEMGIRSYRQTGTADGESHAWNVVLLDGQWCHVDVTWDDPVSATGSTEPVSGQESHTYFGLPDSIIGNDHDFSVTHTCQTMDNCYYVRYGLPEVYYKFVYDGYPENGKTEGLTAQAAAGADPLLVDVSQGYCVSYTSTGGGYSYSLSSSAGQILFPVMCYQLSRSSFDGPDGEPVYYEFSYNASSMMLEGNRIGEPVSTEPVLKLTYELNGQVIQPGTSMEIGQTLTVNWEISNLQEEDGQYRYFLFLTPDARIDDHTRVGYPNFEVTDLVGHINQGTEGYYVYVDSASASGSFAVRFADGKTLHIAKYLEKEGVMREWEEDVFPLTGSESEPIAVDVTLSKNPETRTVSADISITGISEEAYPMNVNWYHDQKDDYHRYIVDGWQISIQGTSSCVVTSNPDHYVILNLSLTDPGKGLRFQKDYFITVEDFDPLPANACGMHLTWTLADDTLTLEGFGPMFDYMESQTPWYGNRKSITRLVLPEGLTYIGFCAFEFMPIADISIPNTVESIGTYAFMGVKAERVFIPKGVTHLDDTIFEMSSVQSFEVDEENPVYCSANGIVMTRDPFGIYMIPQNRAELVIPDGITTLPDIFNEASIQTITIPVSVTRINFGFGGDLTWQRYELKDIVYLGTRKQFLEITFPSWVIRGTGGIPKNDWINLHCQPAPADRTLVLPADTCEIGEEAFAAVDAEECVIPDGTQSIGARAFYNASSLLTVTIPASVTEIGEDAFSGCHASLLIVGTEGSAAEAYAAEHEIDFQTVY